MPNSTASSTPPSTPSRSAKPAIPDPADPAAAPITMGDAITDGLEVYRELLDKSNKPVTTTQLGEVITVRLRIRSLRPESITNVALVDLLPGGFEVVSSSLSPGISEINGVDYVEVREDRAVFYATVPSETLEITYQIKSCNRGNFVVPPVFAESMYDRNLKARGLGGKISVTK